MTALNTIYAAAWTRIETDSHGTTVRAALGGSSSVIPADWLIRPFPATPFLVFSGGDITPDDYDANTTPFGWWIVDDIYKAFYRINALVPLLQAAYPHDWYAGAFTAAARSPEQVPDRLLAMNVRPLFFAVGSR